jgi:hypothetical protein
MNHTLEKLYLEKNVGAEAIFDRCWLDYENFLKQFVVENITGDEGFNCAIRDAEEALDFENYLEPRMPDSIELLRHIITMAIYVDEVK